jgi:hypothetical protein
MTAAKKIVVRMLPGETTAEFIARAAAARPPLTDAQKARLRAIFRAAESKTGAA